MMLEKCIQKHLSDRVENKKEIGTGLFKAYKIKLGKGGFAFIKYQNQSNNNLIKEAEELNLLGKTINTPKVLGCCENCLILEWIDESYNPNKQKQMAFQLAKLHKNTNRYFGFDYNNKIGNTEQINAVGKSIGNWSDFYWNYRLLYQIEMAYKRNLLSKIHYKQALSIKSLLTNFINEDIKPSLLHGDLWSGNTISDNNKTYFIDTASYYGHREADFSLTYMFGGFSEDFYQHYNKEFPFDDGYERRKPLYMLYHYLNHLNIFGSSYSYAVVNCINKVKSI